jgi:hypothetical protein
VRFLIIGGHFIADISGFLALIFISATAILMSVRNRIIGRTTRRDLVNKIHVGVAVLGGAFLLLHADYFLEAPLTNLGVLSGYIATGVALVVWFTGFSFLERLRYSLLYHGSLSLFAIALMVVHSINLGFSIPLYVSEALLGITAIIVLVRAFQHIAKMVR